MKRTGQVFLMIAVAATTMLLIVFSNLYLRFNTAQLVGAQPPQPALTWDGEQDDAALREALYAPSYPIGVNSATLPELLTIPQLGEVTAVRLIQYRDARGGFSDLEQLRRVQGIDDGLYRNIAAYLYLDQWAPPGTPLEEWQRVLHQLLSQDERFANLRP